jgi:hypothetical protein
MLRILSFDAYFYVVVLNHLNENKNGLFFFADGQDEGGSGQERGQAEGSESSEAAETVRVAIRQPSKPGLD